VCRVSLLIGSYHQQAAFFFNRVLQNAAGIIRKRRKQQLRQYIKACPVLTESTTANNKMCQHQQLKEDGFTI